MKIAVLSDVHGNFSALQAVVADIARRGGVDEVINLGNMVSGPLMPLQTAHFLMRQDWLQIAGNHDPQVLQVATGERSTSDAFAAGELDDPSRWWLAALQDSLDERLHSGELWKERLGAEVALCHGTPRSTVEYLLETAEGEGIRTARASARRWRPKLRSVWTTVCRPTCACWPAAIPTFHGSCASPAAC